MFVVVDSHNALMRAGSTSNAGNLQAGWREVKVNDTEAAKLDQPGTKVLNPDGTLSVTPPGADVLAQQQQAALDQRKQLVARALNNPSAYLDPAMVPNPTAAQLSAAKLQRDAWAQILGANPLSIPVTQAASAADVSFT